MANSMKTAIAAAVAVENTAYDFDKPFHYLIPDELKDSAVPGVRVIVPFGGGNRMRTGIILSVTDALPKRPQKIRNLSMRCSTRHRFFLMRE